MGSIVLIPDRNLFHIFINRDIDVGILERAEQEIGPIVVIPSIEQGIKDILSTKKVSTSLAWKTFIFKPTRRLDLMSKDIPALEILDDVVQRLKKPIKRAAIAAGASNIDTEDITLVAISKWMRDYTDNEPVIVSEDKHLLSFSHIVSSYFGIAVAFMSGFELLRLVNAESELKIYCDSCDVNEPSFSLELSEQFGQNFKSELEKLTRNRKIALHPCLRSNDTLSRITS